MRTPPHSSLSLVKAAFSSIVISSHVTVRGDRAFSLQCMEHQMIGRTVQMIVKFGAPCALSIACFIFHSDKPLEP